jgi:hypothetical protein
MNCSDRAIREHWTIRRAAQIVLHVSATVFRRLLFAD